MRLKDEAILKQTHEAEELNRRILDLERALEQTEIRKQSLERQLDLLRKQFEEKERAQDESLVAEKQTRD